MGIKCSGRKEKKRRKGKEKKGTLKMNLFTKEKDGKIQNPYGSRIGLHRGDH